MRIAEKRLFSAILQMGFLSELFIVGALSERAAATIPVGNENVVAARGWEMGSCTIPSGPNSTSPVYFGNGETINMPVHINKQNDNPDTADIFISTAGGSPVFPYKVEMGESRYAPDGTDKYANLMQCFSDAIYFNRPDSNITANEAVQGTIDRFRDSTLAAYQFTPTLAGCPTTSPFNDSRYKCPAVQLEFFVSGGIGYVRITNNCAVRLMDPGPSDYNIVTGSNPIAYHTYKIYGYHYRPNGSTNQITVPITNTYVSQTIGSYTSDPGGQIYVNGNVVIGGDSNTTFTDPNQVVKGKITVVATGNIWIADSIRAYGPVDRSRDPNGIPDANTNTSVLGLIAQGVIKVVDPGLSPTSPASVSGYTYQPIGNSRTPTGTYPGRWLPDPTVVEAALTVGGGGWGAENVVYPSGGRRVYSTPQDYLIVHGSITEVIRGVVGHLNSDGYIKRYYYDERWNPAGTCSGMIAGDLDGDCTVDMEDLEIIAAHWLRNNLSGDEPPVCTSPITGDINNDCKVDFADLATMAAHWMETIE